MAHSTAYTFGFAAAVCVFCSTLVAGAATSLSDLQKVNRIRDTRGAILGALQVEGELRGEAIDRAWDERVRLVFYTPEGTPVTDAAAADLSGDGALTEADAELARQKVKGTDAPPPLLPVYQRLDEGSVGAMAIPVYGKGLWGPVSAYIALAPDLSQVIGTTFFAPKETPGLGAEIQEPAFEDAWKGKQVFDGGEPKAIAVTKPGTASGPYEVDGISGATITCRGVDAMIAEGIENHYAAVLAALRP